jgi:hypothetical protein
LVTVDQDRFSDGRTVVAMTAQDDGLLAVRCIQKVLTLAVTQSGADFKEGDLFRIKFRADANPIVETAGDAINDTVIEILTTQEMRMELTSAREYAFRIATPAGSQFDKVFKAGAAARALSEVLTACPVN